jgi:hypothetical protein
MADGLYRGHARVDMGHQEAPVSDTFVAARERGAGMAYLLDG